MISFGLFEAVHDFIWNILTPFCPFVRPPHNELVSEGGRYICHVIFFLLYFCLGFLVIPLVGVQSRVYESQTQSILLLLNPKGL